nr:MAG: ORF1 [TTV-like mini virus]
MPYFWRRPRPWRRRLWRRRLRPSIRGRFYRRRYRKRFYKRRVRKRKLKFLHLKEWQPSRIRKLKIKGTLPTYITTKDRVTNNLRLYEDEFAPHLVPSMGGFSITTFTLGALYELFQKGRCWWTHSNDELPLIRYTGCQMKLFRSEKSDAIYTYFNCLPMNVTVETYNSTQPVIMQLSKNRKIVRCKQANYSKKPYVKLRIKPPAPFESRWYTQKDIADIPLVTLMASAMSLDRYYTASNSQSTTIGFWALNLSVFKYHNYTSNTTHGYHPRDQLYLYSFQQGQTRLPKINEIVIKNLIFLGQTGKKDAGTTIGDTKQDSEPATTTINRYFQNHGYWGNVFVPFYLTKTAPIIYSTRHPTDIFSNTSYQNLDNKLQEADFKYFNEPFLHRVRYNPLPDTGIGNNIYVTSTDEIVQTYNPPTDKSLERPNLPLWIAAWGLIDWWKLTKTAEKIDTKSFLTIQTDFFHPQEKPYVVLDDDFINGYSPYRSEAKELTATDALNWHPKTTFQYQTINNICQCAPGTIKLPKNVSAEGHINFTFYFKLGGCAQDIKRIKDPDDEPPLSAPYNILASTSLQNPKTALENYLFSFDWRRDYLTQKATERILQSSTTETSPIKSTGINLFNYLPPIQKAPQRQETSEENEEETLQSLFNLLQQQQRKYERRILHLMQNFQ